MHVREAAQCSAEGVRRWLHPVAPAVTERPEVEEETGEEIVEPE
jgi:hypothetical protein